MERVNAGGQRMERLPSYADLPAGKRAVVDEVIAAANIMLEQLKSGHAGKLPHLAVLPIFDQLRAIEAVARSNGALAEHFEEPARDAVRSMLESFGRNGAVVDAVGDFVNVASSTQGRTPVRSEPLFSDAASRYLADLRARRTMSPKDIGRYGRMLSFFQQVFGDRTIPTYAPDDLRQYVALLQKLPTRFDPQAVRLDDHGELVSPLPDDRTGRLSVGTISSYLAPVRAVFARECKTAKIENPCDNLSLEKPRKNRPSRSRPLSVNILNKTIRAGRENGALACLLLPIIGLLTARRIGLLTFLNEDWLEKIGDHYIVRPTETVMLPGREARTPIKTDESMVPFALHDELVRLGVVDLMRERRFLFLEAMQVGDPAAALSKRMNKLLRNAGARGRAYGETFHSIRSRGITHYREHVPQAVRLQAGHAARDEHETYDWAEIDPELLPSIAGVPLPVGLDLSPIRQVDFAKAIALERRLDWAREKRSRARDNR